MDAGGEVVEGALDCLPDLLTIVRFRRLQRVVKDPLGANLEVRQVGDEIFTADNLAMQ